MKVLRGVLRYGFLATLAVAILAISSLAGARGGQGTLDVNSVASDPTAYKGSIRIQGVVAKVSPADFTFSMIDLREYKACKSVSCAIIFVPVHYAGALPAVKDILVVTGEVASTKDGFVFEAQKIQQLKK